MMLLSEAERDRLLVFLTAELARARRRRGLRLRVVEATALVADAGGEAARGGGRLAGVGRQGSGLRAQERSGGCGSAGDGWRRAARAWWAGRWPRPGRVSVPWRRPGRVDTPTRASQGRHSHERADRRGADRAGRH